MCKQSLLVNLDDFNVTEFYQKHQQSRVREPPTCQVHRLELGGGIRQEGTLPDTRTSSGGGVRRSCARLLIQLTSLRESVPKLDHWRYRKQSHC